jgi:hypothetical protein
MGSLYSICVCRNIQSRKLKTFLLSIVAGTLFNLASIALSLAPMSFLSDVIVHLA